MKLSEIISEMEDDVNGLFSPMRERIKAYYLPKLKALNDEDWVSVEDRLPECFRMDGKKKFQNWVLGIKGKSQFVCIYTKGHELEYGDEDPSDEEYDEIEERNGCLYLKAGWYELEETPRGEYDETWVGRNPTHWRPLPTSKTKTVNKMNKKLKSDDRNQKTFWCAVDEKGKIILDRARLPIYYLRRVAKTNFKNWKGAKIIKVNISVTSK